MVNNYGWVFLGLGLGFFYISPFSGLKLGRVIVSVATLFSSAKPIFKLIDTAERTLAQVKFLKHSLQEGDPVRIPCKEGLQKLSPYWILENLLEKRLCRCPDRRRSFGGS